MEFGTRHQRALDDVLRWRRDVRRFRRDPVDPALLATIERAVDLSPSVGNSRPWRMVRVRNRAMRAAVAQIFQDSNGQAAGDHEGADRAEYLALKLAGLNEAPVHLAVFTDPAPAAGRGLGRRTMPETLSYSTAMAIHTLWLAARARNIGVGWVSILDPNAVKAILQVPEAWQFTAYLCLGHPAEPSETPELDRVGWQNNVASVWLDRD